MSKAKALCPHAATAAVGGENIKKSSCKREEREQNLTIKAFESRNEENKICFARILRQVEKFTRYRL